MMASESVPTINEAVKHVSQWMDANRLKSSLNDHSHRISMRRYANILAAAKGKLPILLTDTKVVQGVPEEQSTLFEFLEANMGLQPVTR